ncbi:DUF4177 domain-containing protein [Kalamiella sp. sgz302252]|uniref:DUF4177 domain-containing protein n=1 Tax=Pantoea sp. sgz302252 TaxID=3341827 RepID=UPI0036D43751
MYQYKMIQVAPTISIRAKDNKNGVAAQYLESVVNELAREGWEFQRIDTIGIEEKPGCFGDNEKTAVYYYIISFRKEV